MEILVWNTPYRICILFQGVHGVDVTRYIQMWIRPQFTRPKVVLSLDVYVILGFSDITTVSIAVGVYIISVNADVYIVSSIKSCDIGGDGAGIIIFVIISGAAIITVIITIWVSRLLMTYIVQIWIITIVTITIYSIYICESWKSLIFILIFILIFCWFILIYVLYLNIVPVGIVN